MIVFGGSIKTVLINYFGKSIKKGRFVHNMFLASTFGKMFVRGYVPCCGKVKGVGSVRTFIKSSK